MRTEKSGQDGSHEMPIRARHFVKSTKNAGDLGLSGVLEEIGNGLRCLATTFESRRP